MPPPEPHAMQPADLIITARWIIPVEPEGQVLDDHALVVRDGQIIDLLPAAEAMQRYVARSSSGDLTMCCCPAWSMPIHTAR
jgi:hypothetical protein